mgnify:CR=1 FL=1
MVSAAGLAAWVYAVRQALGSALAVLRDGAAGLAVFQQASALDVLATLDKQVSCLCVASSPS